MTAPRFKFRLLLGVIAAGIAAVAVSAPFTAAADSKSAEKESADVVTGLEERQASLETLVAEQDAAARRAIDEARRLATTNDTDATDATPAASNLPAIATPASGELLHSAKDSASTSAKPRTIRMMVTAYCPCTKCCGPNAQGITASGKRVSYNNGRFVAADKKLLPFGTKLKIPGYHDEIAVEVTDTGSAIKGNRLDVYYPSHQRALEWGRQWLDVEVVE